MGVSQGAPSSTGQVVAAQVGLLVRARLREAVLRFRREVEVAADSTTPTSWRPLDVSEDRGVHVLAREFIEGQDLDALVAYEWPRAN